MTILSGDIKLRESERMTDTSDGGGRRTNNLIVDGVAGNIFPKVSRVDSVYGRVNLRKVFGHVDTANVDTYAGAHLIITDAPDNDRIHVTAFSTASDFDNRTAARDRIESYVIAGPVSRMTLYGRQLLGTQALLAYQREEEPLPEIGEVYAVSTEVGSVTSAQQFFAIQAVDHEVRTFTDAQGDFSRRVVTLTLGAPLRYEFNGPATPVRTSGSAATGVLRSTTVADASRYFGIKPLSIAAAINDLAVNVSSVYSPLVPSTQREAPLSLVALNGANYDVSTGPTRHMTALPNYGGNYSRTWHVGGAIKPGTVKLHAYFTDAGYMVVNAVDDGAGIFVGGFVGSTVDYENGTVTVISNAGALTTYRVDIEFEPVVATTQPAHTKSIEITIATRGTVYSVPLLPVPALKTLIVDYRSMGKWYRLRDDGTGALIGGSLAYGTGTIDYVNGSVVLTLGALPDVGSSLILTWGSPTHYDIVVDDANPHAVLKANLPSLPVKRGSVVCTYYVNGVAHTASASMSNIITGDNSVTGTLNSLSGALTLQFGAKLPDAGTVVSIAYDQRDAVSPTDVLIVSGTFSALTESTLANAPFDPGSVTITVPMHSTRAGYFGTVLYDTTVTLVDDGTGHVYVAKGTEIVPGLLVNADTVVGTVNYTTGAVALTSASVASSGVSYTTSYASGGGGNTMPGVGFIGNTVSLPADAVGQSAISAGTANWNAVVTDLAATDVSKTHIVDLAVVPLTVELLTTTTHAVVPGSVYFALAGQTYFDRNGVLYLNQAAGDMDITLVTVGSVNYVTGDVSVLQWKNNTNIGLSVQSCLTTYGDYTTTDVQFRIAGSPIRPASLYIQANDETGAMLTGTCDNDGIVTGAAMVGKVEQIMGVASLAFGSMVTAAGHEAEPWFNAGNVVAGQIWRPRRVLPGTIRYSAVVLSNLPLNADVLGLDPVRLPSDGRVPIFRPADVGVVHHTASYNAGTPTASATVNVGRTNLSDLWLEDSTKKKLATTMYSVNLTAGTATMAADLSLTGYTPPIAAKHRIEEMVLFSDVQLNGTLSLTGPLSRAYPLGSFVSSALLFGDLFARVTGVFDQATWTGAWSDSLIGSGATAQYNDIDYPIEVLNSAAVTDRWRIHFTSTTSFQVISENLGVIGTGDTSTDVAIVNPLTSQAYFTIRHAGWGSGWSIGNQLRFSTVAASPPMWLARTVLPGATLSGDSFDAQLRGDVD